MLPEETNMLPPLTADNAESVVTYKFSIEAGLLVRGQIRNTLKLLSFQHGIELKLEEDKGWLGSLFMVRLEGRYKDIMAVRSAVWSMLINGGLFGGDLG